MAQNFLTGINIVGDALSISGTSAISSARHFAATTITSTGTVIIGAYGAGGAAGDGWRITTTDIYGQTDAVDKISLSSVTGNAGFAGVVTVNTASVQSGFELTVSGDIYASGNVEPAGYLYSGTIAAASSDTDKFIVSDSGVLKYRTGVQLLSDIDALPLGGGIITGHVLFNDGIELRLGADTDMGLFASSGTSNIRVNEGIFALRANDLRLMNQANDESYIRAVDDGAVTIYYNNLPKLRTASIGVGLDVMSGHEAEGIVRIGRYDANISRYHDIKSYVSSTAASNYLNFSLHNGTENSVSDVMTLKGDLSATFTGHVNITGSSKNLVLANSNNIRFKNNAGAERNILTLDSTDDVQFGGSITDIRFLTDDSSEKMIIKSDGSVGIGTDSPDAPLHVSSSSRPVVKLTSTDASANPGPVIYLNRESGSPADSDYIGALYFDALPDAGALTTFARIKGTIIDASDGDEEGAIVFDTTLGGDTNVEAMRIVGGKVGIGTSTPGTLHSTDYGNIKLQISGGSNSSQLILDGTFAGIIMSDNNTTADARVFQQQVSAGVFTIKSLNDNGTSGSALVSVLHGGDVGIGTDDPGYRLEIAEDTNGAVDLLRLRNADLTYAQTYDFQLDTSKDLVITGSSGSGGVKFVPGSRGVTVAGKIKSTETPADLASAPTIAFGDGNTGFYERSDNDLRLSIGGAGTWEFSANCMGNVNEGKAHLNSETATATNPSVIPWRNDADTGIGRGSANVLSLIAGGVEALSLSTTSGTFAGNVIIGGDLTVNGTTVTLNSTTLAVDDKNIELGSVVDVASQTATLATSTAVVTVASTSGYVPGAALTKTAGTGVFGSTPVILTVDSATQFTANVNHATAGAITFTVGGATDATANLGGITLKGTTDKTILWTNSTDTWDFNQNIKVTSTGGSTYLANFLPSAGSGYAKLYQDSNNHMSLYMANASGTANVVLNSSGVSYVKGGNFIIGGSSDSGELLQVEGTGTFTGDITAVGESRKIRILNAGAAEAVQLLSDGSGDGQLRINNSGGTTQTLLYGEANTAQYIDNGGNLGVGTKTPSSKLQIGTRGTASALTINAASGDGILFDFYNDGNPYLRHASIIANGDTAASQLEFWTSPSGAGVSKALTLDSSQNATFAGNIVLGDDDQIQLGAESGGDMHIRHSGSHGYISNTTGDLFITDTNGDIYIQAKSNENSIACWNDEGVYIYYNAVKKFETTSDGITVTGNATMNTTGVTNNVMLVSTDTSASSAPDLVFYRNAGAPVDSDTSGLIEFRGRNAIGGSGADTADIPYGTIYSRMVDVSDQDSNLSFGVNKGNGSGALITAMLISPLGANNSATGAIIINPATAFTKPLYNLTVNGTSNITGAATFGGNVTISSSINRSIILDATQGSGGYTWASFKQSGTEQFRIFGSYADNYLSFYNDQSSYGHQFRLNADGSSTFTGSLSITGDGSNAATLTESGSGLFTIDAVGDIGLDAGGGDLTFLDDGVEIGRFINDSTDFTMKSLVQDKDIKFMGNDGGSPVTALTLDMSAGGNATFAGNIHLADSKSIYIGTGDDLRLVHTSDTSYITNQYGNLEIIQNTDDGDIIFKCDDGSGGVETYFFLDGSQDSASPYTVFPDSAVLSFGATYDTKIFSDGTDSYIQQQSGHLYIKNDANDKDILFQSDDGSNGVATYFYLDGSQSGSGNLYVKYPDDSRITLGDGSDLYFYHDGTDSKMENSSGDLVFDQKTDDADMVFKCDDGSGGTTAYITLDGDAVETVFSKNTRHNDAVLARFGAGNDLELQHDGNDSYITIRNHDLKIQQLGDDKSIIFYSDDGSGGIAQYFKLDGSAGYNVASKDIRFDDSISACFGTGIDAFFNHNGSHFNFFNDVGDVNFTNRTDDGDIIFASDNGGGGTTEYFRLDGGDARMYATKEIRFMDGVASKYGADGDLEIYHSGSHGYLANGTGDFNITSNDGEMIFTQNTNDGNINFNCDDGSGGVTTYLSLDGGITSMIAYKDLLFGGDDVKAKWGASQDLEIYHSGSDSYIRDMGSGSLRITASKFTVLNAANSETMIDATENAGVLLYYDNSNVLETVADGAQTKFDGGSGAIGYTIHNEGTNAADDSRIAFETQGQRDISIGIDRSDSFFKISHSATLGTNDWQTFDGSGNVTFAGNVLLGDAKELIFGAATDFKIYHNNTTNVNHVSSQLDRQLSINGNIINLTNQANDSTYLLLNSTSATFAGQIRTTTDIGRDDHNRIMFSTDNSIIFRVADSHRFRMDSDNFSPYVDSSYDLGTNSVRWRNVYADTLYGDGSNITGVTAEWDGSHTGHATIFDAGNGNTPILHVKDTADTMVALFEGNRAGDTGANVHIRHWPSSAAETNRTHLHFEMKDDGNNVTKYGTIGCYIDDYTGDTEDGNLRFSVMKAGTSTETMRINATGVGIGTTSPDALLDLESATPVLRMTDTDSSTPYELRVDGEVFSIKEVSNSRTLMSMTTGAVITLDSGGSNTILNTTGSVVVPNGKVGIGTTTPDEKLHIVDSSGANIILNSDANTVDSGIYMSEGADATPTQNGAYVYYDASANNFNIATGGGSLTDRLTIARDTGYVGIGDTSPDFNLTIQGAAATEATPVKIHKGNYADSGGHTTILGFGCESAAWAKGGIGYERTGSYDRGKLHILMDNTGDSSTVTLSDSVMTIQADGNVGIGTDGPTAKLHLYTSGAEAINLGIQNSERYYKIETDGGDLTFNDVSAGGAARMTINSSGNTTFAGDVTITSSGSSNSPSLAIDNPDSNTFNHGIEVFGANMTTTETQLIVVGKEGSTKNSGYIGYNWVGAGSDSNYITFGHWGADHQLKIYGSGNATFAGSVHLDSDSAQLQLGDDNDMQIYHNGANGEINNATGDFTIDSAGDIILDADGADIRFKDAGTEFGRINNNSSGNFLFLSPISDKDIIFKGNDGGSEFVALTLDMSNAGSATFSNDINVGGNEITFTNDSASAYLRAADALLIQSDWNTGENKPIYLQPSAVTELTVATGISTFVGDVQLADTKNLQFIGSSGDHARITFTQGDGTTGDVWSHGFYQNSNFQSGIEFFATDESTGDGKIRFKSGGNNVALTLDASQNATFAGSIESGDINITNGGTTASIALTPDGSHVWQFKNSGNSAIFRDGTTGDIPITMTGADSTFAGTIDSGAITSTGDITIDKDKWLNIDTTWGARPAFGGTDDAATYARTIIRSIDNSANAGIDFQNYAGSSVVRISDAGNVGIGTTSPESKLAVKGTSGSADLFSISDVGVPTTGAEYGVAMIKTYSQEYALNITSYHDTGKGVRIYTDTDSGNCLLVTQPTGDKFTINGSGNAIFGGNISLADSKYVYWGGANDFYIGHDGDNTGVVNSTGHLYISNYADDKDIVFQNDNGAGGVRQYFFLDGSIAADGGLCYTTFPDNSVLTFGDSQDIKISHQSGHSYIANDTGDFIMQSNTNDGDFLFKCDDGNGGTTEYFRLDGGEATYSGATTALFTIFPDKSRIALGTGKDLQIYHDANNSYIETSSGSVGDLYIKAQGSGHDLYLQATDDILIRPQGGENGIQIIGDGGVVLYYNDAIKFQTTNTGATVTGAFTASGDVFAFSDERLKTDIKTLDGSKVYDMRGVSFKKDGKDGSGIIAQELEKIAPELVDNESEYKSIAYGNVTGYLIEAIKDLKAEIEELKNHKCDGCTK